MASQVKARRVLGAYGSILCKKCAAGATKQDMWDQASEDGHHTCLAALLNTVGDVTWKDWADKALITVAERGQNKCIEVLIAAGVDMNSRNRALIEAALKGQEKCVELLIQEGAVVNKTLLTSAYNSGDNRSSEVLTEGRADGDFKIKINTALINVALDGQEKCVEVLIQAGADVNTQNKMGFSALMNAAWRGHNSCLKKLITAATDVNIQNCTGTIALMDSAREGHDECIDTLITAGADVNISDDNGNTALMYAADKGQDKCVGVLITAGADVNSRDKNGDTALHLASSEYHISCIKLLIQAGCDFNVQNKHCQKASQFLAGETALRLLFAAGEKDALKKYTGPKLELRLSHLCRVSIRKHLLQMCSINLFAIVPELGLPKPLQNYVLFTEIIDEDDDQ